jgi:magnesium-protoporphyrin O-methyltransferase
MTNAIEQHKGKLRSYFDGIGFERWSAIYRNDDSLSRVRQTIHDGHAAMLAQAQAWLLEWAAANGASAGRVLDAGCGTGLFSVALARRGFSVTAADIAPQMIGAAQAAALAAGVADRITFHAGDLESVGGSYDAVACFDVLVHYPRPLFEQLCAHLARRTSGVLLLTYAPATPLLSALHKLSSLFPHGDRRQDIQMMPERVVAQTLGAAGLEVRRSVRISRGFYHVVLLEAVKRGGAR